MSTQLHAGLHEILTSIAESTHSLDQLNRLVEVAHALATAFVKSKIASGSINPSIITLSADDIAYDCIAELFQIDDHGCLVQIKSYVEGLDLTSLSEPELLSHMRRLVFSKVNHGVFRLYNDADPVLGKILRNIKLAVTSLRNFEETDRFGETLLVPALCEPLYELPPYDQADLQREFRAIASPCDHVPGILAKLSLLLREQDAYCRAVPLMAVAFLIRVMYVDGYQGGDSPAEDPPIAEGEVEDAIGRSCRRTLEKARASYVSTGKADESLIVTYLAVVEESLRRRLIDLDGKGYSYFEALRARLPQLTEHDYRKEHKSRVEYLGRMAYEAAIVLLRRRIEEA